MDGNFSSFEISIFLHLSKHYSTGFFRGLKINAIDGKRSELSLLLCKRTANATLIYDLNTMKGTVESCVIK